MRAEYTVDCSRINHFFDEAKKCEDCPDEWKMFSHNDNFTIIDLQFYMLCVENKDVGCIFFMPRLNGCRSVNIIILPGYRGKEAVKTCRALLNLLGGDEFDTLLAKIKKDNKKSYAFAKMIGLDFDPGDETDTHYFLRWQYG